MNRRTQSLEKLCGTFAAGTCMRSACVCVCAYGGGSGYEQILQPPTGTNSHTHSHTHALTYETPRHSRWIIGPGLDIVEVVVGICVGVGVDVDVYTCMYEYGPRLRPCLVTD